MIVLQKETNYYRLHQFSFYLILYNDISVCVSLCFVSTIYTLLATRHLSPPHMFYLNNCLRPREVKLFNVTWKWIISQHPQMNGDLVQQQQWNETSTNNSRNKFATQHLNIVTFRLFTCICKHTLMVPRCSSGGVWTSVCCSRILSHAVVGELNQQPSYYWTTCSTKLMLNNNVHV